MNPPPKLKRKPIVGLLPAGAERIFNIQPPIQPREKPLLVGPTTDFSFEVLTPTRIVVRNHGHRHVAFMVTVVPALVANATMLPWGQIWDELQKPGGPGRVLQGFLEGLSQNLLPRQDE